MTSIADRLADKPYSTWTTREKYLLEKEAAEEMRAVKVHVKDRLRQMRDAEAERAMAILEGLR